MSLSRASEIYPSSRQLSGLLSATLLAKIPQKISHRVFRQRETPYRVEFNRESFALAKRRDRDVPRMAESDDRREKVKWPLNARKIKTDSNIYVLFYIDKSFLLIRTFERYPIQLKVIAM